MRILAAVAELEPYVTTGGLGNAVAGLSRALSRRGHDVTVAIPGYGSIGLDGGDRTWMSLGAGPPGVVAYLDERAFRRPGVYGPEPGTGYEDNWWRYARFSAAVAELAGDFDVLHLHDAHVAPVAALTDTPAVLTIHNAAFQLTGPLDRAVEALGRSPTAPLGVTMEWFGSANFLKAGLVTAKRATTVSPTHAAELATNEGGFGLGALIRALPNGLVGILNGIDVATWDPSQDDLLPARFSSKSPGRRAASRRALVEMTGIEDGVIFGNVGRMSHQKGLSLVDGYLSGLVDEGMRIVLMGSGELDDLVDAWVAQHPDAVARLEYDPALARLVFAGADVYLMPSEYEPSGLGQIYAMQYGCPPLVHATGGLADSVVDIDEDPSQGNGLLFRRFDVEEFSKTVRRAMRYRSGLPKLWRAMQVNGMTADWSWDGRAGEYEALFEEAARS